MFPLPFCFIVCCHSCFLQQQYYLFNSFLSLNCNLCSACFNTSLFFISVELLIQFYAFWSFIPDTTGVSDPYYLKASCLYFQFSALIPICFHDIKKEKNCDLSDTSRLPPANLYWALTQPWHQTSWRSPHQFIFFIFLYDANSLVFFPTQFCFFFQELLEVIIKTLTFISYWLKI